MLQSFEWGEVKSFTNWQPLRLMVEEDGRPVAALSILKRSIPGLGKSIFYAPRGPVADLDNHRLLDFLWQKVREVGREHGAILFKLDQDVPYQEEGLRLYLKKQVSGRLRPKRALKVPSPALFSGWTSLPPKKS